MRDPQNSNESKPPARPRADAARQSSERAAERTRWPFDVLLEDPEEPMICRGID